MRILPFLALLTVGVQVGNAQLSWTKAPRDIASKIHEYRNNGKEHRTQRYKLTKPASHSFRTSASEYYTRKTREFWINGTAGSIPEVDFDISDSFAGLLPISKMAGEDRKFYFWFFPSTGGDETKDDIVVWLNGGPGCSSLEGFLQENGPFSWRYGTFKPVANKYAWNNLTNMLWVEQPIGTGFSQGTPDLKNEEELAQQFLGFMENFISRFDLKGKRIWLTGESYAGMYIPYIADAMFTRNDKNAFNIRGTMIYDPSFASDLVLGQIPSVPFVIKNNAIFNFPNEFVDKLKQKADDCGYSDAYIRGLQFPPEGTLNASVGVPAGCNLWDEIFQAATQLNPCFNIYHIATTCPTLWDVLGFPGSFGYLPEGAKVYFDREDVQKAINAPNQPWSECSNSNVFPHGGDHSEHTSYNVFPRVIEKSDRTVIAHGLLDYILIADGTLMAIQNMTWAGQQGFSERPSRKFNVPHDMQGELGVWHEERGLTYVEVRLAGHMVPQYQPGAAYRHLEYLLGRIKTLS